MNVQLLLVILCVVVAAFVIGRRFVRALRSRGCVGCGKTNCCDPASCPEQQTPEELRPRR